jgi:Rha family phage regulatory protein
MTKPDGYLSNPLYREIAAMLTNAGIPHRVENGGRHCFVILDINGREYRQVLHIGSGGKRSTYHKTIRTFRKLVSIRDQAPLMPLVGEARAEAPSPEPQADAQAIPADAVLVVRDGVPMADSRDIAEAFGKDHKNVLRDIRNLECSDEFNRLNFEPVEYKDAKGESRRHFFLTKDGFAYLCMGFTGARAAAFKEAYIARFNAMEASLRTDAPAVRFDADRLQNMMFGSIRIGQAVRKELEEFSRVTQKALAEFRADFHDRALAARERDKMIMSKQVEHDAAIASLVHLRVRAQSVTMATALDMVGVPADRRNGFVSRALAENARCWFIDRDFYCKRLEPRDRSPWLYQHDRVHEWWASAGKAVFENCQRKASAGPVIRRVA